MRAIVFFLVSVVLASCTGAGFSSGPHEAHVLRIADLANPDSLNPLLAHDQETIGYDLLFVQTLIGLDDHNRLVPLLLTSIPSRANGGISADGKRITYHLRHGIRFADGVELTSKDVDFTYRAILDSRNNVLSQDAYRRIASLVTPDRYTVLVRLRRPWNAAVSDLFSQSDFAFGILPAHAFSSTLLSHSAWEDRAFGTGPFRVTQWRRGDRVILTANPYFSPRPKLKRIELIMIPDGNTAFVALRTHDVDIADLATPQMREQARSTPGIRILRTPLNGTEWISILASAGPTSQVRVRRAIAYALDMSAIRKTFGGDYPQAGSFLPPVMARWYNPLPAYPHDLQRARALLGAAPIDADMVIPSEDPLWSRIATIVQQELVPAGIRVSIKKYPTALFNAPDGPIRNARFTLAIDGWLGGADPEQSIIFTCSQTGMNGDNISRYCDPTFEALFADQAVTPSLMRRRNDFLRMQRLIHDAFPVAPLYYVIWFDGVSSRVEGFARNMLQYPVSAERWDTR